MKETEIEQLLPPLRERLYRFARCILGSAAEAEDVAHDTLERLWRRRAELAACRRPEAFALTSLRNACIDRLRRRGREEPLPSGFVAADDPFAGASEREWVRAAMARLPLRQREVLHLKEIEGYAVHEIAALYGIEANQVRTILSRARRRLREELEKTMNA